MLIITGRGTRQGELPASREEARRYFADVPSFLEKLEEVETVRPLKTSNAYLVTHVPIGALNYVFTVAYVLLAEPVDEGLRLSPLDFDPERLGSPHPVLKGFVTGALTIREAASDATRVELDFSLSVEVPLPGALKLVPRGLIQTTADGLMSLKLGASVGGLYEQVRRDFALPG